MRTEERRVIRLMILKAPGVLTLGFGLWIFLSVFVFGVVGNFPGADWNYLLAGFGIMVFASAWIAVPEPPRLLSWFIFVFAVWVICSPFVIRLHGYPVFGWNQVASGILTAIGAVWTLT